MATRPEDLAAAQALRGRAFGLERPDSDGFDAVCRHVLIEDADGMPVCVFRLLLLGTAREIARSYAAQFYDLERLAAFPGPVLELGRFALHPDRPDPRIPRIGWAALTRLVDRAGVTLLFGCSSFPGTDPAPHAHSLALLGARHRAPARWAPGRRARESVALPDCAADPVSGLRATPPLLRSYLAMGGWVSDHAVIDRSMKTLHVFTGVEVARIPAGRARALRALAAAFELG